MNINPPALRLFAVGILISGATWTLRSVCAEELAGPFGPCPDVTPEEVHLF